MVSFKTHLTVNDGQLAPTEVAALRQSSPDMPLDELRTRYEEDGYLFLKGLIPRTDVLKAREEYFKLVSPTGVLEEGTQPVEGVFNSKKSADGFPGIGAGATGMNGRPGGDTATQFVELALQAHTEDWYAETFCKHPSLHNFIAKFTGWEDNCLGLTRSLLRNNVPGTKPIGVHYDQIFLRYGEPTSVTAWVPMGDVKVNGGGLIYLENGVPIGQEIEDGFYKKAKECGMSEEEARNAFNRNMMTTGLLSEYPGEFARQNGRQWLASAYEAGDVVLHQPCAIHASAFNEDPEGVIRLATDLRFVDSSRTYDTRWTKHYEVGDGV